jgi:PAS domain-containing protein
MVYVTNAVHHNIHVTANIPAFTGMGEEDFRGIGWQAVMHPEDRERYLRDSAPRIAAHQPFAQVYRMRSLGESWPWVHEQAEPRRCDGIFAGYVATVYRIS